MGHFIGNISAKNEDFCYGAEKWPYGPPFISYRLLTGIKGKMEKGKVLGEVAMT